MSIALNIALPLPAPLVQEVLRLHQKLDEQPNAVPLLRGDAIAHLTLAMGVIEEYALEELKAKLAEELRYATTFQIRFNGVYQRAMGDGRVVCGIGVEPHSALQALHEKAMDVLSDVGFVVPHMGALFDYQHADPYTLELIQHFRREGTYNSYFPHITLGTGTMQGEAQLGVPTMEVNRVEVFHMGNLCTARKGLQGFDLRAKEELAFGGLD